MAICKLVPIKKTLNKAIDYIINPEKTDNGLLVSSFGCSVKTADIEMKITATKGSEQGNRIAYHLLQSFSPEDDITPEKALELGKEFASKVTGGQYEYVIATHIDQGHIHNHIIFNAVSFTSRKKYHSKENDKHRIRRINDNICKENNLSVIEKTSGQRGHGKYEDICRKKKVSWKQLLGNMIDSTIAKVSNFEEFREQMELEGCEIKMGKHISFRAPGQEKFCRGKTIGEAYTEAAIRARIDGVEWQKVSEDTTPAQTELSKTRYSQPVKKRRINLIADISNNLKAQQSKGYERALVKGNINTLVSTINYLSKHNLVTPDDFQSHYSSVLSEYNFAKKDRKKISSEMMDMREKIKFLQNYKKNKSIYLESLSANGSQDFFLKHEEEMIQYKAAVMYFEREDENPDFLNLHRLFEEYKNLKEEKIQCDKRWEENKKKKQELDILKQNIEYALDMVLENREEKIHKDSGRSKRQQRNGER